MKLVYLYKLDSDSQQWLFFQVGTGFINVWKLFLNSFTRIVGFGPSISAGGPSSLFWGWFVVSPFVMCIALSMAEIISSYPLAGGVYSWSLLLSSKKWGPCKYQKASFYKQLY